MTLAGPVSGETPKAGTDGSGVVCVGAFAGAEMAGGGTVGTVAAGAMTAGSETVGATAGAFATSGGECFRPKKKVAATATRTVAATRMKISVVEFDLAVCPRWDDRDVTLAAEVATSAAGSAGAGAVGSCGSGGAARILPWGTVLDGTILGGTALATTTAVATFPDGTELGASGLGASGLGASGLVGTWLSSVPAGFGALRGGT